MSLSGSPGRPRPSALPGLLPSTVGGVTSLLCPALPPQARVYGLAWLLQVTSAHRGGRRGTPVDRTGRCRAAKAGTLGTEQHLAEVSRVCTAPVSDRSAAELQWGHAGHFGPPLVLKGDLC